jgi:hypothetical protein
LPLCPGATMDLLVPWVRMVIRKIVTTHPNARAYSHVKNVTPQDRTKALNQVPTESARKQAQRRRRE